MFPHHPELPHAYRAEADATLSSLQGGFGTAMDQVISQEALQSGSQIESTSLIACVGCAIITEAFSCALHTEPNKKKHPLPRYLDFLFPLHLLP